MSGGQQRRVSLACSLIHCPPLLILDEPTVGTDPVLRRSIWSHLETLSSSGHTIIVTTHYIDEARKAHTVAFMRNGRLVAQENPDVLLNQYGMRNLEEVFLKLCLVSEDDNHQNSNNDKSNVDYFETKQTYCYDNQVMNEMTKDCIETQPPNETVINDMSIILSMTEDRENLNNIAIKIRSSGFFNKQSALLQKNFKRFTRNWIHFLFGLLYPTLMFLALMLSVGDGPTNMNLAVF